jgi:glycosyltransferase involved in cell wall biosynthesis
VIRDGEDGLLVPCKDPAALASAIESLLADDTLRGRLGRNGRDKVLANHRWSTVVERVHRIYEQVASEWHH